MPNSSHRFRSRLPSLSALLHHDTTLASTSGSEEPPIPGAFPEVAESERRRSAGASSIPSRFPHSEFDASSTNGAVDNSNERTGDGREHLHYRDDVPPYPLHLYDELTGNAESPTALSNSSAKEEEAMLEALSVSIWEMQRKKARENREAAELRRVLEESASLARQTAPVDPKTQEQRELSQAILESRRQALNESKRHSAAYRNRTVSAPTAYTPPLASPPVSLEESERILLERNAKGRLYAEGGSHGWLPLGAARVETEEEIEQRELSRAIALSVAEEQARKVMVDQMTSYINGTSNGDALLSLSTSQLPSKSSIGYRVPPPLPPRSFPSSHPAPPLPATSPHPQQSLSPTSSALRQKVQISVVIPPSSTTLTPTAEANGSPTERPYLTPVSSYRSYFPAEEGSEEDGDSISRRASTGTFGEYTTPGSSERSQESKSGMSAPGSRESQSTESHSDISHETQFYSPAEIDPARMDTARSDQSGQHQQFYTNTSAGRSMSSISQRTEPLSLSLPLPPASTFTSSPAGSFNASTGPDEPITPIARRDSPNWFNSNAPRQQDLEIHETTSERVDEEREEEFETGVRFGFPAECVDAYHSCLEDGLGRSGFPKEVTLSLIAGVATFSIEARTWNELLRFLLWYGDTVVKAAPEDIRREQSRHSDASMTLEFRRDDEETGVVRLNIHLLPPNQSNQLSDLTLLNPPLVKGKAIAQQMSIQTFQLADNLVLPLRISSIAVSLYTLRHLSGIYNTFDSNDNLSNAHAKAYRALAMAIKRLSDEHHPAVESNGGERSSERLVKRLRDRVRFWRTKGKEGNVVVESPSSSRVAREGRAKLIKPPPAPSSRTRNVDRDVRILAAENERESAYSGTAEGTENELRYMPRLLAGAH